MLLGKPSNCVRAKVAKVYKVYKREREKALEGPKEKLLERHRETSRLHVR